MAFQSIDIGTTGCKCAVFANDGTLLAKASREYGRPPGATEFDGMAIWRHVCSLGQEVVTKADEPVAAISVASIGEAFAPVDAAGIPLHPFFQSTDPRGNAYVDEITTQVGDRVRAVTGLNPLARYSVPKLVYLRRERPELLGAMWKIMMLEDFIIFHLSGVAATDYSAALRSAAFDLHAQRYDPEILAVAGLDESSFCRPFPAGTVVGTVTAAAAAAFGLSSETLVVLGGHDTIPENLSAGLLATGTLSLGCGTFEGIGTLIPKQQHAHPQLLANNFSREPYPLGNQELVNAINPNAGNVVRWFRATFAEEETLSELDAAVPPEPSPLLVIPHLAGTGAPQFDTRARGSILGLRLGTTRAELYRAFLQGIAYEMRFLIEKLEECGIRYSGIIASSGGAKSRAWLQIRADILNHPITPMVSHDTTLAGCAMLAGTAAGVYSSLEEAAAIYVRKGETVEPDPARHALYQEFYNRYMQARDMVSRFWSAESL